MTITLRIIIEFVFGLFLVVAAIFIGFNQNRVGPLADLLLTLLSLPGIFLMAHAIWLVRSKETR
jgi:NADH:ubiquinone oxidoreductase subunit 6 (subunit J)